MDGRYIVIFSTHVHTQYDTVDGRYIVIFSTHVHTQYDTVDGRYIVIFSTHVHTQYDTVKCHTNCNYNTSSNELLKSTVEQWRQFSTP